MMKISNLLETSFDPKNLSVYTALQLKSHCCLTTPFLAHYIQRLYVGRLIDNGGKGHERRFWEAFRDFIGVAVTKTHLQFG